MLRAGLGTSPQSGARVARELGVSSARERQIELAAIDALQLASAEGACGGASQLATGALTQDLFAPLLGSLATGSPVGQAQVGAAGAHAGSAPRGAGSGASEKLALDNAVTQELGHSHFLTTLLIFGPLAMLTALGMVLAGHRRSARRRELASVLTASLEFDRTALAKAIVSAKAALSGASQPPGTSGHAGAQQGLRASRGAAGASTRVTKR